MTKKHEIDNKYEAGTSIFKEALKKWWAVAFLIIISGAIFFILQIKTFQCGNVVIEKDPIKTPLKK